LKVCGIGLMLLFALAAVGDDREPMAQDETGIMDKAMPRGRVTFVASVPT